MKSRALHDSLRTMVVLRLPDLLGFPYLIPCILLLNMVINAFACPGIINLIVQAVHPVAVSAATLDRQVDSVSDFASRPVDLLWSFIHAIE